MIKKSKLPTILGIIILLAGTFAGVFFLNMKQFFRIGASGESAPKDVRLSNITGNSATVNWTSDKETYGFLKWGGDPNSLSSVDGASESDSKYFIHSVTISGLKPNSKYYFKINSDGSDFDNNGVSWQFTTGAELGLNTESFPISGSLISASGSPEERALIYLNVSGYLMSTLTSSTGNFVFQLGSVRSTNLQDYAMIDPASTLLEVTAQTKNDGFSNIQIFPQSANPIPVMILGQSQDLRSLPPSSGSDDPEALLNLPEDAMEESKFDVQSNNIPIQNSSSVILESIKEGEVISTDKPQFFGKAPNGTSLTIVVHSDQQIEDNITVPKNGSWSWAVPQNLSAGPHSIVVSWVDSSGITRSLTRNFVVQAAEVPSFTASQSGTVSTPTPIPTPLRTSAPEASLTPSPQPVPVTGELTPTLFLFIMGIGILVFSFGVWKIAEEKI